MERVIRHEQEQIAFYHRWLREAYRKNKPPEWADNIFQRRFKTYPLDSWKLNAVFPNATEEERAKYFKYLNDHSWQSKNPEYWRSRQLELNLGINEFS
ncbi:MAG: hypothetical protein F6K14_30875 [Symploca sp. SIO2C1]|nr:hypothetical protein [Symploca sp. SIO2C1]